MGGGDGKTRGFTLRDIIRVCTDRTVLKIRYRPNFHGRLVGCMDDHSVLGLDWRALPWKEFVGNGSTDVRE